MPARRAAPGRGRAVSLALGGLALAWLAATPCATAAPARLLEGTVTHVSDGDTLWIRPAGGGRPVKVRVQGIDAPERCQPWGAQATQALAARVLHQAVRLEEGPHDGHGRQLGRLMQGDQDVGALMVREGHAWSYRWRRNLGPYAAEEQRARAARKGLWADPQARLPREFRQAHGPCPAPGHAGAAAAQSGR
jgi:endonuclease YncB( thermonuclease family)